MVGPPKGKGRVYNRNACSVEGVIFFRGWVEPHGFRGSVFFVFMTSMLLFDLQVWDRILASSRAAGERVSVYSESSLPRPRVPGFCRPGLGDGAGGVSRIWAGHLDGHMLDGVLSWGGWVGWVWMDLGASSHVILWKEDRAPVKSISGI